MGMIYDTYCALRVSSRIDGSKKEDCELCALCANRGLV